LDGQLCAPPNPPLNAALRNCAFVLDHGGDPGSQACNIRCHVHSTSPRPRTLESQAPMMADGRHWIADLRARGGPVYPTPPGRCCVDQPAGQNARPNGRPRLWCSASATQRPFIGGPVRHPPMKLPGQRARPKAHRGGYGRLCLQASPRSTRMLTLASFGDTRFHRARLSPGSSRSSGPSGPPLLNVGPGGSH
jgi:hypothetical protein